MNRRRRRRRAVGALRLRALHAAAGRLNWSIAAEGGFLPAGRLPDGSSALAPLPQGGPVARGFCGRLAPLQGLLPAVTPTPKARWGTPSGAGGLTRGLT